MSYATAADLNAWLGVSTAEAALQSLLGSAYPDGTARLLARASELVDTALIGAVYTVDSGGLPTDATVTAALRDAVTAQVEWWVTLQDEMGIQDHLVKGVDDGVTPQHSPGRQARLAPRAKDVLHRAKLLPIKAVI